MSSDITRTSRQKAKKPSAAQVADIIGSALYVAQNGGLIVEVKPFSSYLSIRIGGLTAINDNGELQIVPLQDATTEPNGSTQQNATTEQNDMPLQNHTGNPENATTSETENTTTPMEVSG